MNLVALLCRFEFIIGLFCLGDILSLTQPLSVILQKETIDLPKASDIVTSLVASLSARRKYVNDYFDEIFSKASKLAEKLDIEIKKPRNSGRQIHLKNNQTQTCKDYYRVSTYIPLLEMVSEDIKTRFSKDVLESFNLSLLLPKLLINLKAKESSKLTECLVERYSGILKGNKQEHILRFKGELSLWQEKWKRCQNWEAETSSAIQILKGCDKDIYPTIHTFLRILCTLPATNASAERSFSSLRRIKTWLRTTMLQKRLNGLALLSINYDIDVEPEKVIKRFSKMGKHRIGFDL